MGRARQVGLGLAVLVLVVAAWPAVRTAVRSGPPAPTAAMRARAADVRILRDRFGVPHVFGRTDADTAFGLAYAHAEDDFPTIQDALAAARGQLGLIRPGRLGLLNDGYAALVDVEGEVERGWETIDPRVRDLVDGYADGLNLYAWHHPDDVDARLLPYTGRDVVRGFVHKLPLMLGLPGAISAATTGATPAVGPGSNAHAIAPWRSSDGVTRLNVNSHQPWEGPVAWYEVHVHSEEGWDAVGGTFPGAPVVLHGHNAHVGWALTVNHPDTIDAYALVTAEDKPDLYRYDDAWWPFAYERHWLPVDTPWVTLWVPHTVTRTVHGPVLDAADGRQVAFRWSSRDRGVRAVEQWYRMNRAGSAAQLRDALGLQAIPMFNVVYADREHVGFVYNAALPVRDPSFDWRGVLPGDTSAALWTDLHPLQALPQVHDPWSGFVSACNSTPYRATLGGEAPDPEDFPDTHGIETLVTNRTLRTVEILADGAPVSRQDLLDLKWDRAYSPNAPLMRRLIAPLASWTPTDPDELWARDLLLAWDGRMDGDSTAASLAVLAWRPLDDDGYDVVGPFDPAAAVAWAVTFLRQNHGSVEVPLSTLQRLHRGDVDLPLAGGPDVLGCTYHALRGGELVGDQGDSYVMIVEFGPDGVRSDSIHQYGASNRPASPHYADQAPLFVEAELKPVLRTEAQIRRFLEAEYHPGEPWTAQAGEPRALLEAARAAR